jgi:hypothetical protein
MEKKCFKCGKVKPLNKFHKHPEMADGHLNKCKECARKDIAAREKELREDPEWVKKERGRGREKYERLYKGRSGSGTPQAKKKWIERNKLKRAAHLMVSNAIRDGRLFKEPCEICGEVAEAHHDDYYKPLEVTWLCIKHHNAHHVKMRELETNGHTR